MSCTASDSWVALLFRLFARKILRAFLAHCATPNHFCVAKDLVLAPGCSSQAKTPRGVGVLLSSGSWVVALLHFERGVSELPFPCLRYA